MTTRNMNPKVDAYFSSAKKWQEEMEKLRMILLDCELTEELKWAKPTYMFQNNILAIIIGFKEYCALSFFKGALLKDANGILIKPGENSQASRQIRFTSVQEIVAMEAILKAYIYEAIEVEKAGLKYPNNPKRESQGLKNTCSKSLLERDWMIRLIFSAGILIIKRRTMAILP